MDRLRRNVILALCVLFFSFLDENIETRHLSQEELKKDVSVLRKALEKYHPGLYWYTSKKEFDLTWDSLIAHIDEPMSEDQFLKLLLPVIAKVQCAHTLFYPSKDVLSKGTRFPLDLKFINRKGYIMTDSLNEYHIPTGSELLVIDGRPLNQIVDLMLPSLMAQGGNVGWKYVILENDFQNYYYYLVEHTDSFEIEYIDRITLQKTSVRINGSSEQGLKSHWKNWYPIDDGAPLKIEFLKDPDVAIITIKSLSKGRYKSYNQDFDRLIDQYFEEIERNEIRNLIIDVRGNEGGNSPEKVYSYIAGKGDRDTASPNKLIAPAKKYNFRGSVIVLANEKSISAQETFVSIFQNNKRGLTIGLPTPGCYKGLCGGKKHRLVLPNSHHEIRIPLHASFRTYSGKVKYTEGEGFLPDIRVVANIDDVIGNRDTAMELAIAKFKNGL